MTVLYRVCAWQGGLGDIIKFLPHVYQYAQTVNESFKIDMGYMGKYFDVATDYQCRECCNKNECTFVKPSDVWKTNKYKNHIWQSPILISHFITPKPNLMPEKVNHSYISIHLRMGDKYLNNALTNKHEERISETTAKKCVSRLISSQSSTHYYFSTDSDKLRRWAKSMFSGQLQSFDIQAKHTGEQGLDDYSETVREFAMIAKSTLILSLTYSGFSLAAHMMYGASIKRVNCNEDTAFMSIITTDEMKQARRKLGLMLRL